jgi:hypothetical protein
MRPFPNINDKQPYGGVDPGRTGALALIEGTALSVWDMPPHGSERGIDVAATADILRGWPPNTKVALEWNTGRPNEVPDFAFRFGLQTGQLDALCYAMGLQVTHLASNKWTGKLGLPGKSWAGALEQRAALFAGLYPHAEGLIRGPKGGLLDGRLDALLIAHYMKLGGTVVGHKGGRRPPTYRGTDMSGI